MQETSNGSAGHKGQSQATQGHFGGRELWIFHDVVRCGKACIPASLTNAVFSNRSADVARIAFSFDAESRCGGMGDYFGSNTEASAQFGEPRQVEVPTRSA